jgi:isoleucyl-tRNA synthetase
MDTHGADAVRWFMAAGGSPWLPRRVGHASIQEVVRKVLLTYWNTAAFQALYGRIAGFDPTAPAVPVAQRPVLDRWALSELHRVVAAVDEAYEHFDPARVGQLLTAFVDDLSNWYVRRSRRRFWDGDPAALATLHECLDALTRLLAPLVPFITEQVWQLLVRAADPGAPLSVHLADFPVADPALVEEELAEQVALVRRLVELGRAARAEAKVRTRQPLARALIGARGWDALDAELREHAADELNVLAMTPLADVGGLVDHQAKANFRALGKRFGPQTPLVAAAVAQADAAALAASLAAGEARVEVPGVGLVTLGPDDVVVTETPQQGWAVAREGETVALDLHVTPELARLGLAREVVRAVQDARKRAGLEVTDRIALAWEAEGEVAATLREHAATIASEVLALTMAEGVATLPDGEETVLAEPPLRLRLRRLEG